MPTKKRLTFIIVLLCIATYSVWLIMSSSTINSEIASKPDNPRSYMTNVKITQTDKAGLIQHIITSPKLINYEKNNLTEIVEPSVVVNNQTDTPWHIHAKSGQAIHGLDEITFFGNVRIQRTSKNNSNQILTLTTSKISFFPKTSMVVTNQPVTIIQPESIVHAIGLQADLKKGIIKLLSKLEVNMALKNTTKLLINSLLMIFMTSAIAANSNNVLHLTADSAQIDYINKMNVYTGHVQISTKDTVVKGNKIVTINKPNNQVNTIIAYGKPAHFRMEVDDKSPPLKASAQVIKFYPQKHLVILTNKAIVKQGANTMQAPIITYDTKRRVITSTPTNLGRTHITIDSKGKETRLS